MINTQSFLKSIKQGVNKTGEIFNPVTAFKTVKESIKTKPIRTRVNDAFTPKVMKQRNRRLEDELNKF